MMIHNTNLYSTKRKIHIILCSIFVVAIIIKLICAYYVGNRFHPNVWEYEEIATNILHSKGFLFVWGLEPLSRFHIPFRSIQEPFFPILCAVVYFFTNHSLWAMLLLQIFYTSLIPIVVFYILYKIYDARTALLGSILALFLPGITFYSSVNLHQMPLYALFFCLILFFTLKVHKAPSLSNQLLLGLFLGLGLLTRSTTIFILLVVFVWLGVSLKSERRRSFILLRILFITTLVIMPWEVRNFHIHKKLVLFQSSDGYFLYIATNPQATATLYLSDGRFQLEGIPGELLDKHDTMTEMEFRELMLSEAWKYIREDPIRVFRLALTRLFYFWGFSPLTGRAPGAEYPERYITWYKFYYFTILFLFLSQVMSMMRQLGKERKSPLLSKELLVVLFLVAISIPHVLLYSEGRHKFSVEPLFLLLASRRIMLWADLSIFKYSVKRHLARGAFVV